VPLTFTRKVSFGFFKRNRYAGYCCEVYYRGYALDCFVDVFFVSDITLVYFYGPWFRVSG